MSGWFGYSRLEGEESPTDPAYSRVTNPERFGPLHPSMLEILGRLENNFDVERTEGYGLDEELEKGLDLARPSVRLTPKDPEAAPIVVAFLTFRVFVFDSGDGTSNPFQTVAAMPVTSQQKARSKDSKIRLTT